MTTPNQIQTVSVAGLKSMIRDNSDLVILDVLPPDLFENRHIPGAKNACVFYASFTDDLSSVAPDIESSIVVYGSSPRSHDSRMAAEKMERAGYSKVTILEGGLEAWQKDQNPCEGNNTEEAIDPQTTLLLNDGNFTIDTDNSTIRWEGRNPTTSHFGTVNIATGNIAITDGDFSGEIEVDMDSIQNINLQGDELQPVLEAHLKSDDFFFTSMFPKAILTFKEVKPAGSQYQTSPNFHVTGDLTLRGVNAPLNFEMTVNSDDDGQLLLEAHFDIDRTKWNIIYGSTRFFEHLGMHKVFDLISIQLRILAKI